MSSLFLFAFLFSSTLSVCGGSSKSDTSTRAGIVRDAVYDVVDLSLASALPGCAVTYTVMVVDVVFNGTLRFVPVSPEPTYSDIFAHATFGTLQLRCGACSWSSRAGPQGRAHVVSPQLIPLEHASSYATSAFASKLLFSRAHHTPTERREDRLRALLFVAAEPSAECAALAGVPKSGSDPADHESASASAAEGDLLQSLTYRDACFAGLQRGGGVQQSSAEPPKCELVVLPAEEQLKQGRSVAGEYTVTTRDASAEADDAAFAGSFAAEQASLRHVPLQGAIPLRRVRNAYTPAEARVPQPGMPSHALPRQSDERGAGPASEGGADASRDDDVISVDEHLSHDSDGPGAVERARLMEGLRAGRSILRSAFPQLYGAPADWRQRLQREHAAALGLDGAADGAADGADAGASLFLETAAAAAAGAGAGAGTSAASTAQIRAAALAAAAATAEVGLPGLDGMLKPILDGLLKPVTGVVTGVMGDLIGDAAGNVLAGTTESGMTAEITALLSHGLTVSLTESLVPPLAETLTDALSNTFTAEFRDAVTPPVAQQLTETVSASVSQTLSRSLARQLEADVPDTLAELLSDELVHYLTQSVTQAVVPALTMTLHHNPAEDYFCAYCAEYKLYCDYCRKDGPEQLMRAQYYAAYFSRYYANVFARKPAPDTPPPPPAPPAPGGKKK